MMDDKVILFSNKKDCCGCGACANICSKNAISMQEDDLGFLYPIINHNLCIKCKACKRVCAFQNKIEQNEPRIVYASSRKNNDKILKSASGGIFSVIAENIVKNGGIVYGAALKIENNHAIVKHVKATSENELEALRGSKYVQSDLGNIFKEIKEKLLEGSNVLFSGTPCQVASLKMYLKKDYKNLCTIDIICHGVPNQRFLSEYLSLYSKRIKKNIIDLKFRDKTNGWGLTSNFTVIDKSGTTNIYINSDKQTYYTMFLDSEIYRESCYSCKYASKNRPGDITIGDYWGIEKEHSNYLIQNGGKLSVKNGISLVIINNEKGENLYNQIIEDTNSYISDFSKAAKHNHQLLSPSKVGKHRNTIIKIYTKFGYNLVDRYYMFLIIKRKVIFKIKRLLKSQCH